MTAALLLLLGATVWGLQDVLLDVHTSWSAKYGPYAHGYAILALAAWLGLSAWRRHEGDIPLTPWWPGAIGLAAVVGALVLAELLFVGASRQALLPLILLAAISTAFGLAAAKLFLWPVLFLYFALPQWWLINQPLQDLTAAVSNTLVRWTGVPAFVTGHSFELPAGVVEIASGCSGLNYLMAGLALGFFQGLLFLAGWRDRMKLLAVAALAALVANWLRVYSLILIGYWSDMQHYLVRVDHLYYGWVLFLACMWPVFTYGARLERTDGSAAARAAGGHRVAGLSPRGPTGFPARQLAAVVAGAAVSGALLLSPAVVQGVTTSAIRPGTSPPALPRAGQDAAPLQAWSPSVFGAEVERLAFEAADGRIDVFRGWFPDQRREAHLRISLEQIGGLGWRTTSASRGAVALTGRPDAPVHRLQGVLQAQEAVLRVAYVVSGRPVAGSLDAKLADLKSIAHGQREAYALAVLSPCEGSCAAAGERLERYLAAALAPIVAES